MDILSETIAAIRTGRPAYGLFVRHAPWGRRYPVVRGAGFHVVLQGSCWVLTPGAEPFALGAGDVLFMPRGADHDLVDQPGTPITEVAVPGEPREIVGPGVRTALVCGAYELGRQRSHPLLDELPEFVHLPARPGRHPALRSAVDLLAGEIAEPSLGTDAVIPALLDTLLLYILRAWFAEHADTATGWAGAFTDPAVAAALRVIHDDPAHAWTVPELGAVAGVSRATLARRFTATVGEPPLSYLTRWRLLTAARLLRESDTPLAGVARKVGYQSEFAFAKAFKREYGSAPGQYRRTADSPDTVAV
ncbi:AraC family transcriptional regulator [Nocardia sp. 2]|uniref:AraC family transcriptional regulator n=1 Tax=Nocardia acididurans TaxID=2802282 RepID=A0ABS1MCL0_9NOCA|nr:AraC family transcriptional regulator [Nocardia acididurans]MBL1077454.1 AraC family transcriptional regulator [Nocardia acididurans]